MEHKKVLFISGAPFLEAYSGTKYLIETLVDLKLMVSVLVLGNKNEKHRYKGLNLNIIVLVNRYKKILFLKKLNSLLIKLFIFFKILFYKNIIITEGHWLSIIHKIKKLFPDKLIINYCQELWIPEDHPWSKQALLFEKYSKIPDLIIDVNYQRATHRMNRFNLSRVPLILLNTLPIKTFPNSNSPGALQKLADCMFPPNIPILLYTGGVGVEKPFERIIDAVAMVKKPCFLLAFCNTDNQTLEELRKYALRRIKINKFLIHSSVRREKILSSAWEADIGLIDYAYTNQPTHNQLFCAPTKFFEYMASGLAIVTSNNPSLSGIIDKYKIGKYAVDDNIESFTNAIEAVIANDDTLKRMKKNSKEAFKNELCYEKACLKTVEAIKELMK